MIDCVIEPGRRVEADELPQSVKRVVAKATTAGWSVLTTMGRSHVPDTSHYGADGDWDRLLRYTNDELVLGEGGVPELTPTGKQRVRKVPSEVLVEIDWVRLCVHRPGRLGYAWWTRDAREQKWKPDQGIFNNGAGMVNITAWAKELA